MSLIQKLHQAEKNRNYKNYCEIVDQIKDSKELTLPPLLVRQIQARRDLYQSRLSKWITARKIIEKIDSDNLEVIKKSCPALNKFINSQGINLNKRLFSQSDSCKNELLDATITRRKDLKLTWDKECHIAGQSIYYFQALLEDKFCITPLRQKSLEPATNDCQYDTIELDNEFMPIFVVDADNTEGIIKSVICIPFPSLLRGSYHYCELVANYSEFGGISAVNHFSRNFIDNNDYQKIHLISINPENYDVGIAYSNEDFRRWITVVHGISFTQQFLLDTDQNILVLPQDSYPTISMVVNGFKISSIQKSCDTSKIIIADDSDYEPLYKLSAQLPSNKIELQPKNTNTFPCIFNKKNKLKTESILSVLQASGHSNLALYPPQNPISNFLDKESVVQSEQYKTIVIVNVTNAASVTEELILGLVQQQNICITHLIFRVDKQDEDQLKNKYNSISNTWNLKIKSLFNCDEENLRFLMQKTQNTLYINQYIILQDPNTLRILTDNLNLYQSFSAGCTLSHHQSTKKHQLFFNNSVGLHLSLNSYCDTGRVVLQAKNIVKSLLPTEICVLSNHHDLSLYKNQILLDYGFDQCDMDNFELFLVQASCNALLNGLNNVCTTKVHANYFMSPTLNMSITLDAHTSENIILNLDSIIHQVTSVSKLLP